MESFNPTYNFWSALFETTIAILFINILIRTKWKNKRLLDILAINKGYVYSLLILSIIISASYFISTFFYRYWPWLLIASLSAIVYIMYLLYKWVITSDQYNKWLDIQTDWLQEKLMITLIQIIRILPDKVQVAISIRIKLLEELMRFDQNNEFEEQVLDEIYNLGEHTTLVELAKKFGYLKFVYSTIDFTEIKWPDGTISKHWFSSGNYVSNTRRQIETEDRHAYSEEKSR